MPLILSALAAPQKWPASVLILVFTSVAIIISRLLLSRPAWPSKAPKALAGYPVLGSLGFFRNRWSFLREHKKAMPGGQFSFFYGPHSIVALSGTAARQTFFTTRSLDIHQGFAGLFSGAPSIEHLYEGEGTLVTHFGSLFKRFTNKDWLDAKLYHLINDCVSSYDKLDASVPMDPFDALFRLIYQLTLRTLGTNDVANNPKLMDKTLQIFSTLDNSSALQVMFPRIPFPGKLSKMWAGLRLHTIFTRIMNDRRKTGRVEDDAMQSMMDAGDNDVIASAFIIAALFAGLLNTGVNAAWILLYLGNDKEWYRKVRDEVDASISKHRNSDQESRVDVLSRLTIDEWEQGFGVIDLCLRESIRLTLPGATFRKNISTKDVKIGDSGQVIPRNAYAVYPVADIHLDPEIYADPYTWDPSRYLPDRAEDKKTGHAYIGWGTGLHPCSGMRFAKLEIAICVAMFFARYDFDLVDKDGNTENAKLPTLNHDNIAAVRLPGQAWLKCKPRV